MNEIFCKDNMKIWLDKITDKAPNVIYADCIYESDNFEWLAKYWRYLPYNDGVMIIQTDWHTNFRFQHFHTISVSLITIQPGMERIPTC